MNLQSYFSGKEKGLIVLLWLAVYVPNLNVLEVNIMEARNFITAREMLQDNHWLFTTMNGAPRYEKPPLPTWITAAFGAVFGMENVFFLRLAAAFFMLILLLTLYNWTRKMGFEKIQSLIAAFILGTSFSAIFTGREATWDIYTHAFMFVGLYHLFFWLNDSRPAIKNALWAGIFIGFSFMSKGPVSLYAMFLPFLAAYGIAFGFYLKSKPLKGWVLLIFSAVALSVCWPLYIYFFDTQSAQSIADKETAAWVSNSTKPFYYYFDFFTETGIWTIPAFISLLYPYMKKKVENLQLYKFSFWWTIAGVVLLSLIPEKKKRYLFPVIIPLAINISFYFNVLHQYYKTFSRREIFPILFHYGLLIGICAIFPLSGFFIFKETSNLMIWFILASLALWVVGFWMFRKLKQKDFYTMFFNQIVMILSVIILALPLAKVFYDHPNRVMPGVIHYYENQFNTQAYSFGEISPEIIWAYDDKIPQYDLLKSKQHFQKALFLVNEDLESDFLRTFEHNYQVKFLKGIDVNYASPDRKNHKGRLTAKLFILEKI